MMFSRLAVRPLKSLLATLVFSGLAISVPAHAAQNDGDVAGAGVRPREFNTGITKPQPAKVEKSKYYGMGGVTLVCEALKSKQVRWHIKNLNALESQRTTEQEHLRTQLIAQHNEFLKSLNQVSNAHSNTFVARVPGGAPKTISAAALSQQSEQLQELADSFDKLRIEEEKFQEKLFATSWDLYLFDVLVSSRLKKNANCREAAFAGIKNPLQFAEKLTLNVNVLKSEVLERSKVRASEMQKVVSHLQKNLQALGTHGVVQKANPILAKVNRSVDQLKLFSEIELWWLSFKLDTHSARGAFFVQKGEEAKAELELQKTLKQCEGYMALLRHSQLPSELTVAGRRVVSASMISALMERQKIIRKWMARVEFQKQSANQGGGTGVVGIGGFSLR